MNYLKEMLDNIGIVEGKEFNNLRGGKYTLKSYGSFGSERIIVSIKKVGEDNFKFGCELAFIKNIDDLKHLLNILLIVTEKMYIDNNKSLINL